MRSSVRICLAQILPGLGNLQTNRDLICRLIAEAAGKAEIIAFPELALTGYNLQKLTPQVALTPRDSFWHPLLELSQGIRILIGFVLESADHQFFNAAAYLENGEIKFIHRKVYLPTYGLNEEGKWFAKGDRWECFTSAGFRIGVLICEESWHLSPAYVLFLQSVDILFILTNSSTRGKAVEDMTSAAHACRVQNAYYARMLGCYVCFVNRVGTEEGVSYWGGSEVISPNGQLLKRAEPDQEQLIYLEIDRAAIRDARIATPLRRDEMAALTIHNIQNSEKKSQIY